MFAALARFAFRRRIAILVAYAVLLPVLVVVGLPVFTTLRGGGFEVPDSESNQVYELLQDNIKVGSADLLAIYTAPSGTVDDIEPYTAALEAITRVEKDPFVVTTASFYTTGATQLVTADKKRTFILIALRGDDTDKAEAIERLRPLLEAKPMTLQLGGYIPVNAAVQRIIAGDLKRAELVAFPITAILLLIIFGSAASASLPLALGAMTLVFALAALRTLTLVQPVSIFAINIVSLLGLGLAIDYSLFLVNRFREELHGTPERPGLSVEDALVRTMSTTGRAVAFSGVTVAASMIGLFFFPQMFLQSMATGGIVVVVGAVVLALTLLPALMAALGKNIDALRIPFAASPAELEEDRFWYRVAMAVMKRPILVAVAVIVPLLVVAAPFLRFDPSFPDYRILPRDDAAFIANDVLDREFNGKQMTPIDVVIRTQGPALSISNLEKVWRVHERFLALGSTGTEVAKPASVSGLFTLVPGIEKDALFRKLCEQAALIAIKDKSGSTRDYGCYDEANPPVPDETAQLGIRAFASGNLIRFAILPPITYNLPPALAMVHAIRAMNVQGAEPGLEIMVGGPGAYLIDMKHTLVTRSPWMLVTVCLVMFIVLFLVFGSITLPIKAMIMNAFSLTASFGTMVWVFQDGRFSDLLDYVPLGISDCTAPLLMFSIVFGLSMDYEVLLLSRVREEYVATGDNDVSVARGLARTGRLITSAALLLVVVIGAFGTSHIIFMKSLGVGMALAIALDATIIRGLLVPALMQLMGKWNWWAPEPLVKLWKKAGLSDLD